MAERNIAIDCLIWNALLSKLSSADVFLPNRFYLGYPALGVLMLVSLGGCFVLAVVDLILIATGELQPKWGDYTDSLD